MDKTRLLCSLSGFMMREFSRRTTDALKQHKLFKLLLPPFQSFLEINVRKEIEKDRCVIENAVAAFRNGSPPCAEDRKLLLQKAKEIDQQFVRLSPSLPVSITIRYHDIEQIREQRMGRLLGAVYQLLKSWDENPDFRQALIRLYDQQQFKLLLQDILHLYIQETRLLSNSINVPRKLSFARNTLLKTVCTVMENTAEELASELAGMVYGRGY